MVELDWDLRHPAFDPRLYEDALDPEECQAQLNYISSELLLRFRFSEAGLRLPKGITDGNTHDLGNYHQCIGIDEHLERHIEGKYCLLSVSLSFMEAVARYRDSGFDSDVLYTDNATIARMKQLDMINRNVQALSGVRDAVALPENLSNLNLAVCVPKPCTTQEGINSLYFGLNESILNDSDLFDYEDMFCRLKNDKLWSPADTVSTVIFSLIGLLTVISTGYDLYLKFALKRDPKEVSEVLTSFSVYTNGRRLTCLKKNPKAIECLDGIRSLGMLWIIYGHTFAAMPSARLNPLYILEFIQSWSATSLTAAPISVDTFFFLTGLLVVYTTAGKMNGMKLLKNLHIFYLNRILRMFPLLAAAILYQISIAHRVADGPDWRVVEEHTNTCRNYWWVSLLYAQNYVKPTCIPHSWYLAIDMQIHILSPLVLFWVLSGKKRQAWTALIVALLLSLTAATTYVFLMNFASTTISLGRPGGIGNYGTHYYHNTLTRNSPFLVGMIWGYILHSWRGCKVEFSKLYVCALWILSVAWMLGIGVLIMKPIMTFGYDNQLLDNFLNAFQRPTWAACLGWIVFACHHGYGGPVNWLLSHTIWKVMSRISYAMYLFHYIIQFVIYGTYDQAYHFSKAYAAYLFCGQILVIYIVSFILTLVVDSPFATLFKLLLTPGNNPKSGKKT